MGNQQSWGNRKVLVLSDGMSCGELVLGLYRVLMPDQLIVVVNTANDFDYFGLHISPGLDTSIYTLAGVNHHAAVTGRAGDTGIFMETMTLLGGETWYWMGDDDMLLTQMGRTHCRLNNQSLTTFTDAMRLSFGIRARVLPMSDDPVRTTVETESGPWPLLYYVMQQRYNPLISRFYFDGIKTAQPNPVLLETLADPELRAVIIGPANPFIGIEPILKLAGVTDALKACQAPVVAVSVDFGASSMRVVTDNIIEPLNLVRESDDVAHYYGSLLDGLVLRQQDMNPNEELSVPNLITRSLSDEQRIGQHLAGEVLAFADELATHGVNSIGS